MSEHSLANRHIVVTGGLGVLGRAVGPCWSSREPALSCSIVLRPRMCLITAVIGGIDLTDPDATRSAFQQASERLQGFDGLVNAAGGFRWETLESGTLESWDALYAMNLRSTVVACREALPYLLLAADGSGIVNGSAGCSQKAGMGMGAYAASKVEGRAANRSACRGGQGSWRACERCVPQHPGHASPTGPICPMPTPRAGYRRARPPSSRFCCRTMPAPSQARAFRGRSGVIMEDMRLSQEHSSPRGRWRGRRHRHGFWSDRYLLGHGDMDGTHREFVACVRPFKQRKMSILRGALPLSKHMPSSISSRSGAGWKSTASCRTVPCGRTYGGSAFRARGAGDSAQWRSRADSPRSRPCARELVSQDTLITWMLRLPNGWSSAAMVERRWCFAAGWSLLTRRPAAGQSESSFPLEALALVFNPPQEKHHWRDW